MLVNKHWQLYLTFWVLEHLAANYIAEGQKSTALSHIFLSLIAIGKKFYCMNVITHPALRRRGDVRATSLCTSQWRRRYVSNETPNDVSMERREDVSMVRLHDVLLERHNDVSKWRNKDVPSLRLHDVSNKSQMKHPTTSW